jgi:hypothetical protein
MRPRFWSLQPVRQLFFAMLSAAANWISTRSFVRQLRSSGIDAMLSAVHGLKGSVYRTIQLQERQAEGENVTDAEIFAAHEEASSKWVLFAQTFQVARRYNRDLDFDAPSDAIAYLLQLRIALHNKNREERDRILAAMNTIFYTIATRVGGCPGEC